MTTRRDRLVAGVALLVLAALAGTVVWLVLDAQHAGIKNRQDLRLEQAQELSRTFDTRVQQAYTAIAGLAGAPGAFTMKVGDPADAAKLQPLASRATSGPFLVDSHKVIVNGPLLRDRKRLGTTFDRKDLDATLRGEPTILVVGPGLTTSAPTIDIALPVRGSSGDVVGAYIYESEVTADSSFQQEIAQLRAGRTGVFSFIDADGNVTASTDETTLAHRTALPSRALRPGFHRTGDLVTAAAGIPSAHWTMVFQQSKSEFEGDLTGPIRWAVILVGLLVVVGGAVSVVSLLRRLRAAHEEQRRLAEISQAREEFASIVSHELRTPVAGLLGFLETTVDHWTEMSENDRLQALSRAMQNANRLQQLTTDVLDTTAMETGQVRYRMEPVDLRSIAFDAVETARAASPSRIIEIREPDEPVRVDVDAARIRQVMSNLLDNAVKSSPGESTIAVAVAATDGQARVEVCDRGSGIALGDRERVFEKFTRAGVGLTRGTGLGLYLAREIINAHRGRIWVADTDGPGTTVVFTLPITSAGSANG